MSGPTSDNTAGTSSKVILLADDEAEFRKLMAELLRGAGYVVMEAASGSEAYDLLKCQLDPGAGFRIHAVVTDCKMPDWDGFTLLAKIRSTEGLQKIPVIMISGVLSREEILEVARQKPVDILIKPFPSQALIAKLQQLLRNS